MLTSQISRRDFLKTSGALVVTYALAPKAANAAIDPNTLGPKTVAPIASTASSPSTARAWSRCTPEKSTSAPEPTPR